MKGWGIHAAAKSWMLVSVVLLPVAALADGMVFPQSAYARPDIPDQRALICYADGTETLVIETSFTGQGTNFAWVIPVPAAPKIDPISTGVFPTLQVVFQPQVVLSVKHYWLALPITALLVWLNSLGRRSVWNALVLTLALLAAIVLFLPFFMSAGTRASSSGPAVANVRVLNRQNVGLFDTATIESKDPSALMRWLNENGFSASTNIAPIVADYVNDGWVFVAARLHREAGQQGTQATHPLAFTFQTAKPVYPLRLTGTGASSCRIDLYVFGPSRAKVRGFTVKRCEAPDYGNLASRPRLTAGPLRIRHQELSKLVSGAQVATKLSAVLDAPAMADDAYVTWEAYWPSGGKLYTVGAALTLSANVCALLFLALVLVWWALSWFHSSHGFHSQKWGQWLAPVPLAAGLVMYFIVLPKTDAAAFRLARASWATVKNQTMELAMALGDELGDTNVVQPLTAPVRQLTSAEVERLLQLVNKDYSMHWSAWPGSPLTNFFTGEPIRFEASPGNLLLRPAFASHGINDGAVPHVPANGYELVWLDLDGAEAITNGVVPHCGQK